MQDQQQQPLKKPTPEQIQRAMALFQPAPPDVRLEKLKYLSQELERCHGTLRVAWETNQSTVYNYAKALETLQAKYIDALDELSSTNG